MSSGFVYYRGPRALPRPSAYSESQGQAKLIAILSLRNYGDANMARKPRVHFSGALYHVMSRGNQGQSIFKDDRDRERYLDILKANEKRFGYRLYAYVLMGNMFTI
ncbi:MAG: transposase [Thermoanaerobaculia bacterium]